MATKQADWDEIARGMFSKSHKAIQIVLKKADGTLDFSNSMFFLTSALRSVEDGTARTRVGEVAKSFAVYRSTPLPQRNTA